MFKKKFFFIVFEGIEGSGKSYQVKKLSQKLKKMGFSTIVTREPGGTPSAEKIRKLILKDYFHKNSKEKFDKYTDTLLYLASRNEHIVNKIKPAILKKKVIICDRFTDSTFAYQVYGKGVDRKLIDNVHNQILGKIKPNITFVLKVNSSKAILRLKKRKNKNRYDKLSKSFYSKAQSAFVRIARKNKKRYFIFDNSKDNDTVEKKHFQNC